MSISKELLEVGNIFQCNAGHIYRGKSARFVIISISDHDKAYNRTYVLARIDDETAYESLNIFWLTTADLVFVDYMSKEEMLTHPYLPIRVAGSTMSDSDKRRCLL